MNDEDLDNVASGKTPFTPEQREWALSQHNFLWEYVRTQNNPEALSDQNLAQEVKDASWDYVRCTCM